MKKNGLKLTILLSIICVCKTFADSNYVVNNIQIGPKNGDPKDKFSINFNLINQGKTQDNWKIGFYMPRSFRTTNTMNTKLQMNICEINSTKHKICSPLKYERATFTDTDLSTVFTTILAPVNKFPLKHNKGYIIELAHGSSRMPQNYSALPQSFFIINDNNEVININTDPSTYHLTTLDLDKTHSDVINHINDEWESSNDIYTQLPVVPSPQKIIINDSNNYMDISNNLSIHNRSNISNTQLMMWQNTLSHDFNKKISLDNDDSASTGIIFKNIDKSKISTAEGYQIEITQNSITIKAAADAGFFYAMQTLRQLWQQSANLPIASITDYPRFKYRGILLDTARHFFSITEIKNFIDIMAANKLNTLHLHLSDDEAFRLEIPQYPQLTKIGASRGYGLPIGTMGMIQKNLSKSQSNAFTADTIQAGSYTPSEINDLIKYANDRQITIIPETDIPGHSRAIMKAMPDAFYEPEDQSDYNGFGDNAMPVCAYNSNSQLGVKFTQAINNIISYTAKAFNGQTTLYATANEISIGGDEVGVRTWSKSPECNKAPWNSMDELNKEHYFISQLNQQMNKYNIQLSGWHEFILSNDGKVDNLALQAKDVGHVWQWGNSKEASTKAKTLLNNGYPTVISYSNNLYFDMTYTANFDEPGFYWASKNGDTYAALNSISKVNATENTNNQNMLGLEAGIWTDVIPNYTQLQYMAIPKIAGLSEAAWSNNDLTNYNGLPNWHSLATRLGCGNLGFLNYLHHNFGVIYRGYPNGIALEAPSICISNGSN